MYIISEKKINFWGVVVKSEAYRGQSQVCWT